MIAYLTHDEVNADTAGRLAHELGVELTALAVKDSRLIVDAELIVIDLDHLPPECRAELLARAAAGAGAGLAVHSYHLRRAEVRALRAAGVRVTRWLTAATLGRAATRNPAGGFGPTAV
jgi:hypothetical protein